MWLCLDHYEMMIYYSESIYFICMNITKLFARGKVMMRGYF